MPRTAILVDGGFYLKRAHALHKEKDAEARADELFNHCLNHLHDSHETRELYRIYYYDCYPSDKKVYHPLTQKTIDLKKTPIYDWKMTFFECLKKKRKVALRMGEILESGVGYNIKPNITKKLARKQITVSDLTENDFSLDIKQKGVDMKIGLDIASIAFKKLADQIILIAGDSDFVPAAKHARREGIDFILDPMYNKIKPSLHEHIDGLKTPK